MCLSVCLGHASGQTTYRIDSRFCTLVKHVKIQVKFEDGHDRPKNEKVLVVVPLVCKKCSDGCGWNFQTHPIELKFGTFLDHLKWMVNSKCEENRMIKKKVLVMVTHTGFEWIFQTHPIELKFGTTLAHSKSKLNSEFEQNPINRKKVLVMVTHTGFEQISQTRQIKLKSGIFWKFLIKFRFLHFTWGAVLFGERSEQVRQKNTKILSNHKRLV